MTKGNGIEGMNNDYHGAASQSYASAILDSQVLSMFPVAVEDLVAGLARDLERPAHIRHCPSKIRATKRSLSSIAEHSLHGINTAREMPESVTHVSGTFCHLCLRPLMLNNQSVVEASLRLCA